MFPAFDLNSNSSAQNLGTIILYISDVLTHNTLFGHLFPLPLLQRQMKLKFALTLNDILCIKIFSSRGLMLTI